MERANGAVRRAVVIEDDGDIRTLITHALSDIGLEVTSASTGPDGIAAVEAADPDVVTLDLGLPGIDGIEVCRRIREQTDAYIIMVTARTDEIDRLLGLETGADDFMSKPFSPRELQARVNAMFRRPRVGATVPAGTASKPAPSVPADLDGHEVLSLGALEVDVDGRVARVDGEEVSLTRTEFDLLVTMIRAPRRVWQRDVLLRTVWGDDWAVDHHLVEVHVGNLRRKLGGGSSRYIRTVRGVGYRMEAPG
jgi:DNA-binding response OmpR family regulator